MSPMQAAKEIAKLEVAIVKPKEPKPKPKQTTKAPDPAPTIKSGGADPTIDKGEETQSQRMARWDKEREDRIKAGHGG